MKKVRTETYKNAVIDVDKMTITEFSKDDQFVFDLTDVLKDWTGVEGVTLSIKKDEVITD